MPRVLLLIPSASYRAPDFMDAAHRLGVEVVVGSDRRHPLEDLRPGEQIGLDFADPDAGVRQVEAYAARFPVDAIVAVDDPGIRLAAAASRRLELPHNPVAAVEATRNKALLRERLAAAGVPSPHWSVLPVETNPASIAGAVEYPVVLKPLALSASTGVIRADTPAAFVAAFDRTRRIIDASDDPGACGDAAGFILVEGYVAGVEVSVEALLTDGELHVLAIFDKPDPLEGPFFEETIYVTPSRLDPDEQARIARATAAACAALGLTDGPVHAELRVNASGVYPLDIAARSIGGLCSRTLSFGTGLSLEELILRHALGLQGADLDRETSAAGVMMIPIPAAGVLAAVDGQAEAETVPLIESVTISIHPGRRLVPLPEGGEYLGFIFARGETPAAVEAALREAHGALRFTILPEP